MRDWNDASRPRRGALSFPPSASTDAGRGFIGQNAGVPNQAIESQVFEDDCLDRLAAFDPGSVDLIYADPPFATGSRRQGRQRI